MTDGEHKNLSGPLQANNSELEFSSVLYLVDVSDIFYFCFWSGRGEGRVRDGSRGGRGVGSLSKIPGAGGVLQEGRGAEGREGVCGELGKFLGGGS